MPKKDNSPPPLPEKALSAIPDAAKGKLPGTLVPPPPPPPPVVPVGTEGNDVFKLSDFPTVSFGQAVNIIDGKGGVDTLVIDSVINTRQNYITFLELEGADNYNFRFEGYSGASLGGIYQTSETYPVLTHRVKSIENIYLNGLAGSFGISGNDSANLFDITGSGPALVVDSSGYTVGNQVAIFGEGGDDTAKLDGFYRLYFIPGEGNDTVNLGNNYNNSLIRSSEYEAWPEIPGQSGDDTINLGSGQDNILYDTIGDLAWSGYSGYDINDTTPMFVGHDVINNFVTGVDRLLFHKPPSSTTGGPTIASIEENLSANKTTFHIADGGTITVDAVGLTMGYDGFYDSWYFS